MKFCRFNDNRVGVVRDDVVYDVTEALDDLPSYKYAFPKGDPIVVNLDTLRPKMEKLADSADGIPVADVKFLSPVANPTKIIGVPQNYQDHADEAGERDGLNEDRVDEEEGEEETPSGDEPGHGADEEALPTEENNAARGPEAEGEESELKDRRG